MKKHTKIYFDYFGYGYTEFIPCEMCGKGAVDIHHIKPRSFFGSKEKTAQDKIENLIALCRGCHDDAHNNKISEHDLIANHIVRLI